MPVERCGVKLGENEHFVDATIDAVAHWHINQPVSTSNGHLQSPHSRQLPQNPFNSPTKCLNKFHICSNLWQFTNTNVASRTTTKSLCTGSLKDMSLLIDGKDSLTHACSLRSTSHMKFRLESLKVLPDMEVLDGINLDGYHVEWLHQNLKHRNVKNSSSHFVGPEPMGLQVFFSLSWILLCLVSIPLDISLWAWSL